MTKKHRRKLEINNARSRKKRHRYSKKKKPVRTGFVLLRDIAYSTVISCVFVALIAGYFFSIDTMVGSSMKPVLESGNHVLVKTHVSNFNRFDIISFKTGTGGEVRRIIGMPGERIRYVDDFLYVDDDVVDEKFIIEQINAYNREGKLFTQPESGADMFQVLTIPEDMYLVLGDNRPFSTDSRHYGLVEKSSIVGVVIFQFTPFKPLNQVI